MSNAFRIIILLPVLIFSWFRWEVVSSCCYFFSSRSCLECPGTWIDVLGRRRSAWTESHLRIAGCAIPSVESILPLCSPSHLLLIFYVSGHMWLCSESSSPSICPFVASPFRWTHGILYFKSHLFIVLFLSLVFLHHKVISSLRTEA